MIEKIFGSRVDWLSQHSVFPEYFRQHFYDTGNLFPKFAANVGGGQNIYHFAYYGLYNPLYLPAYFLPFVKMSDYIIVISILCQFAANVGGGQNIYHFAYYGLYNPLYLPAYFLPFVKMSDYIIVISILCLVADVLLFFKWTRSHGVSKGNSILTSILFLLAGPMIFHSYTHLMFVNYMPFLLLALMGTDRYFQKHRSDLLTGSIFLMIMTSFYFSIGGILILLIYGVFQYLDSQEKQRKEVNVKRFFLAGILFCIPILIAVMMSGFLLIPSRRHFILYSYLNSGYDERIFTDTYR